MPPARRARSFLGHEDMETLMCGRSSWNDQAAFLELLGEPLQWFLGLPSPVPSWGSRGDLTGCLGTFRGLPASGTFGDPMRHRSCGLSVRVVRFRCVCNDSLHGLMLALPRHVWCLFLRVDPRHRSTRSDPWSAAASILPIVSFAIVARFRKRAAYAAATAPSLTSTVTTTP